MVGALACGLLVDLIAAKHLIWVIAVGGVPLERLQASSLQPLDKPKPSAATTLSARALLRDRGFLAIIVTSALVQGSHAAYYTFASIAWQQAGLGGLTIAGLWALGVMAEIVLFALSPRFRLPFSRTGGDRSRSARVVRWIITAQSPPIAILAVVQLAHGLTFGLTMVGTMGLLAQRVPGPVMARGQGYLAACTGIVTSSRLDRIRRGLCALRRGRLLHDGGDGRHRRAHHVAVAASARAHPRRAPPDRRVADRPNRPALDGRGQV